MTINKAISILLEYFQNNDTFVMKDNPDFKKDEAAIILGLEELILNNIIKKITISKVDYYILLGPLSSLNQTVTISGDTSLIIAKIIEKVAESMKRTDILVNPISIQEKDILNVITILSELINIKNK